MGKVDRKLLTGAALFGVGWGLAGFCPGPALVALGAGKLEALVFTASMIAGSWLAARLPVAVRASAREQSARSLRARRRLRRLVDCALLRTCAPPGASAMPSVVAAARLRAQG